jgi:hypothetical protein
MGKVNARAFPPTIEEFDVLHTERLRTMHSAYEQCTGAACRGNVLPSGWYCRINILGRDRDGSLLATLTAGPQRRQVTYTRQLRLTKQRALRCG